MRNIPVAIAALVLAGCAQTGSLQTGFAGGQPKPEVVLVSDFTISPELVAIDRGYTARLERKIGSIPTHQRKQRTIERVNDEVVASIITTLRAAGIEAQAGGEDTLTLDQSALVIAGRLHASEPVADKNKNTVSFGAGRGHVVAAMTATLFSSGGKRDLLTFDVDSAGAKTRASRTAEAGRGQQRCDSVGHCGRGRGHQTVIARRGSARAPARPRHWRSRRRLREGAGLDGDAGTQARTLLAHPKSQTLEQMNRSLNPDLWARGVL